MPAATANSEKAARRQVVSSSVRTVTAAVCSRAGHTPGMARRARQDERPCPCGQGDLATGCGPLLAGDVEAATAEQLMRSRYTAFALGDAAHLLRSWHPRTRPATLHLDPGTRWLRLEVLATTGGGLLDPSGEVEFRAHHRDRTGRGVLAERSRFLRDAGRWRYLGPVTPGPLG